jgi:hypothetical protein
MKAGSRLGRGNTEKALLNFDNQIKLEMHQGPRGELGPLSASEIRSNEGAVEKKVITPEKRRCCHEQRRALERFLDSAAVQILMTIVTLYALIGDDLRLIYAPRAYDVVFTDLTIASLFLFSIELALSAFAVENYLNSFFFWLDLVSTASLITDIGPIMDWLSGNTSSDTTATT